MEFMSLRQLMFGLSAIVAIVVFILSNKNVIVYQKTPLPNVRKFHATNIHQLDWLEKAEDVKHTSNSNALKEQPDHQIEDNLDLLHGNQPDDYSDIQFVDPDDINTSFNEQGLESNDIKIQNTVIKIINRFRLDKIPNKPYSPGKDRIISYIKKLHSKLRAQVDMIVKEFNKVNGKSFKSLPDGKMWYVFIEIMKSLGYQQRLPRVIGIGVKKSGTTALSLFVGHHPQISHSFDGKEVHFFDNLEKMKLGMNYYRSRMGFSNTTQLTFEKTPKYFITKTAPNEIFKNLPKDIKFLLCVRDPVKRAISEYHHDTELMLHSRNMPSELKEAKQRSSKEQGKLFTKKCINPQGDVNRNESIIKTSIYSLHFKNWLKTFSRDRFLVIDLNRLEGHTYAELKRVEKFLGLNSFFTPDMVVHTKKRGACLKIKGTVKCPIKITHPGFTKKPKLSSQVERTMYDFYRPYNQEFARLIGQTFDWMNI